MIEIVDYKPKYRAAFKHLNIAWMSQYWVLGSMDDALLSNPHQAIIKPGGAVLFAVENIVGNDRAIGCCALIKHGQNDFELAKMAVQDSKQAQGIGTLLANAAIAKAKELSDAHTDTRIHLQSHHALESALKLYQKLGFKQLSSQCDNANRCDVHMELILAS